FFYHATPTTYIYTLSLHDALPIYIVRFNGTYTPHSRYSYYLHFDSWRLNLQPGVWLPTYIYIEESGTKRSSPPFHNLYFKAQTRDRKSTRLNSSHDQISYAVFCLK